MAAAIVTTTVANPIQAAGIPGYRVQGSLAISASPATYTAGGIAMNLNQSNIKASRTPQSVDVQGINGFIYRYIKGSNNSNGLLKIFVPKVTSAAADGPLIELTDGLAIPALVSGDTITAIINYLGMQ